MKLIYILPVAFILAMYACSHNSGSKKEQLEKLKKEQSALQAKIDKLQQDLGPEQSKSKTTIVSVSTVEPRLFQHFIEVQAKVDADENIMVSPKTSAMQPTQVTEVLVKRGDQVTKGQILARFDPGALPQQVAASQTQYELAATNYKKIKNLWSQNIGTEMGYLQAKAQMEGAQKGLQALQQQMANYTLRSPINGTVDDVNMKVGETPNPGFSYIRVVNMAGAKVVAEVSEAYVAKIHAGDAVKVLFPDLGKEISTRVRTVGKVINATNRTFTVEVAIDPKQVEVHPNMVAVIKVNDYTNKSVRTLPLNVVQNDEKGAFVYIAQRRGNASEAHKQYITTGQSYEGQVEVLSGLNGDEKIITSGYQNVVEGQPINF